MDQDLIDRNVVVMFLDQMADELDAEAKAEGQKAAPKESITLVGYYGAPVLRRAARAIERLPRAEPEDRFTLTEQGRKYLEEAELELQED